MKGTIQARTIVSGGGETDSGEPIADVSGWGDEFDCQYKANKLNNKGTYQDGEFTQSEYEITLTNLEFTATEIQLKDSRGNVVCQKQVQSLEILEAVQRTKITV